MRMFNRQKVLLKSISNLNIRGIKSRTLTVKSQFILKKEYSVGEKIKFYNFFPYKFGPFSQLVFRDIRTLTKEGLINEEGTELTTKGVQITKDINIPFQNYIEDVGRRFNSKKQIVDYVYKKYPKYTIKSELTKHKNSKIKPGILTIGYEGLDIDSFLDLLISNDINLIVDVRKNPFSMNFAYIKNTLKKYLESAGVEYLHIPELGIDSEDRKNLECKEDYDKLFVKYRKKLPNKEVYIKRIIDLGREKRLALLCFEKDPSFCHRGQIANIIRKNKSCVIDL